MASFDTASKKQVETNPQDEETMQQPSIVEYVAPQALNENGN